MTSHIVYTLGELLRTLKERLPAPFLHYTISQGHELLGVRRETVLCADLPSGTEGRLDCVFVRQPTDNFEILCVRRTWFPRVAHSHSARRSCTARTPARSATTSTVLEMTLEAIRAVSSQLEPAGKLAANKAFLHAEVANIERRIYQVGVRDAR